MGFATKTKVTDQRSSLGSSSAASAEAKRTPEQTAKIEKDYRKLRDDRIADYNARKLRTTTEREIAKQEAAVKVLARQEQTLETMVKGSSQDGGSASAATEAQLMPDLSNFPKLKEREQEMENGFFATPDSSPEEQKWRPLHEK